MGMIRLPIYQEFADGSVEVSSIRVAPGNYVDELGRV
jgi:hypothetical protein